MRVVHTLLVLQPRPPTTTLPTRFRRYSTRDCTILHYIIPQRYPYDSLRQEGDFGLSWRPFVVAISLQEDSGHGLGVRTRVSLEDDSGHVAGGEEVAVEPHDVTQLHGPRVTPTRFIIAPYGVPTAQQRDGCTERTV